MDCSTGCGSGCKPSLPCPCPAGGNPAIDSLEKLVNCYWQSHQQLAVEATWYGALESLELAVNEASLALADENVDLDHVPDRIPLTELATARQRLKDAVGALREASDFDDLYSLVSGCLGDLSGVRPELVFLTALRIGMQAGIEPQRIYLHETVRDGAAQLVDLDQASSALERAELPPLLQHPDLPAAVVQNCLAVCRHQLQWLKQAGQLV